MKVLGLLIFSAAIVLAAVPHKPEPVAPPAHVTYRLINFVSHYPHGYVPLAYDKDGCPVFSVDDGFHILKVCEYGQALFAIDKR